MKNIDTLVQDIYNLFTRDGGPPIPQKKVEEEIEIFLEELRSHLLDFLYTKREPSSNLRLSLVGKPDRQTWYEMRNTKEREPLSSPTRIKFLYGHLLEALVVFLVKLSGHEITDQQKEVKVNGIKGHIDCKIDGEVVDIKSTSGFSFNKFKNGTLPDYDSFGYMSQLAGYEAAEGTNNGGFLAINKETGELWFFQPDELDKPDIKTKIKTRKTQIKKSEPPELCYQPIAEGTQGNFKLPRECVWCPHKLECHADSNNGQGLRIFNYAKGPAFFTDLVVEPRVQEITDEWEES